MLSLPVCFSGGKHITWKASSGNYITDREFYETISEGKCNEAMSNHRLHKKKKKRIIETGTNKVGNEEGISLIA